MTLRLTVEGIEDLAPLWRARRPLIYAVWHGQILMIPWLSARLSRTAGARSARVLASRSSDGELVARYARSFGIDAVRGSSSRGGALALRALIAALRAGDDVAVVPDGPRGPKYRAHPGVVGLAALTGAPIVPLGFAVRPAWRLSTWDAFLVPLPFARAAVVIGAPLVIGRDADRRCAVEEVERAMRSLTAAAERRIAPA
jgi:lysophospholipid acyltransferase (LPLAT)-like uncharacterized protein